MKDVPLKKALEKYSQHELAKHLGMTQGAIWQMLRAKREIYITKKGSHFSAWEKKVLRS